jgi:hypothetical protein
MASISATISDLDEQYQFGYKYGYLKGFQSFENEKMLSDFAIGYSKGTVFQKKTIYFNKHNYFTIGWKITFYNKRVIILSEDRLSKPFL